MSEVASLQERFEERYIPEPNSGCWLWLGATAPSRGTDGCYGKIYNAPGALPRMAMAHRISYELHVGKIPPKHEIDHNCKNTLCVNPEHLEPRTRRGHAQITWDRKLQGSCKRGHLMDEKNSWIEKTGQKHCRRCHAEREARNRANKNMVCERISR